MSTGEIQRALAAERNLTTLELNHLAERDFSVDSAVDAALKAVGETEDSVVIDSRMAWMFVPNAFSVHVVVRPDVGDRRLLGRVDQATEVYQTTAEAQSQRMLRAKSERARFHDFYNVNIQRLRNYDVVVDSTVGTPQGIAEQILELYGERSEHGDLRLRMSPLNLIPSEMIQSLRDLDAVAVSTLSSDEFLSTNPIDVIYSYPYFMVVDGHKRLSAALISQREFVPARLVGEGSEIVYGDMTAEALFTRTFSKSLIYDWEDAHRVDYRLSQQDGYIPVE